MSTTLVKSLKEASPEFFTSLTDRRTGQNIAAILGEDPTSYSVSDIRFTHAINPDQTISANAIQMTFKPGSAATDKKDKVVIVPYEEVIHNYQYGGMDANAVTGQQYSNRLLSEVYTRKVNNPFAEVVTINRDFTTGTLDADFIFEESKAADGISYPNIVGVKTTFTDITGARNTSNMSLDQFLNSYTNNIYIGAFED